MCGKYKVEHCNQNRVKDLSYIALSIIGVRPPPQGKIRGFLIAPAGADVGAVAKTFI